MNNQLPKHHNYTVHKLINFSMKNGKKSLSVKHVLNVFSELKKEDKLNNIFFESIDNIKPILTVKKYRKAKKLYYLPSIISTKQELKISLDWLVKSSKKRKENNFSLKLRNEILDCYNNKGITVKKKHQLYETVVANRPFLNLLRFK